MAQKRNRKVAVVQCLGAVTQRRLFPVGTWQGIAARSWQTIRTAY